MSIGQTARALILANPTMKSSEILELVKEAHPEGKTTVACIAWYKNDIKKAIKQGKLVIQQAEPKVRTSKDIIEEIGAHKAEIASLEEEFRELVKQEAEDEVAELERLEARRAELLAKREALSAQQ